MLMRLNCYNPVAVNLALAIKHVHPLWPTFIPPYKTQNSGL